MMLAVLGMTTFEYPSQNWIYSAKFEGVKTIPYRIVQIILVPKKNLKRKNVM